MRDREPLRLKQAQDVPPALVRALEALRNGVDDSRHLERVAQRLEAVLDAALPSVSSVARGAGVARFPAFAIIIGGIALLAPVLWIMHDDRSTQAASGGASNERSSVPKLPDAALQRAGAAPAPRPEAPRSRYDATECDVSKEVVTVQRQVPADRGRGGSVRNVKALGSTRRQSASASPVAPAPTVPAPAPAAPEHQNRPQPSAAKDIASNSPVLPSEAALLFEARKALPRDPTLALQRLAEHERHYPNGQLVPEREVIAIESLRRLGRAAEADARLRRFKARYPESFHLQRLQP